MAFTPPSSIFSGTLVFPPSIDVNVTDNPARLLGIITDITNPIEADVTDRAARLLGHVDVDSLPATTGGATEATLERVADSLDDVGLTAILQRDKLPE